LTGNLPLASLNQQSLRRQLPDRVRVLILGGGCHGLGVLHDLASRGWRDIHLVDKSTIGSGTSSKSTKLIHGGLRYLQHVRDFPLVAEALRERRVLLTVAPDIVKPLELIFPVLKSGGVSRLAIKAGLTLYDLLAGRANVARHHRLTGEEALARAPVMNLDAFSSFYGFWDCQMDDLALSHRVAASAVRLGAGISENCSVERIRQIDDGFEVEIREPTGSLRKVSALFVLNALGPWSNNLLTASGMVPAWNGINVRGAHVVFPDVGLKAGLFLQSPADKRIFFVLPWRGHTLVGTTEARQEGSPDDVAVQDSEVSYLLERCNTYLNRPFRPADAVSTFCGLRWLAADEDSSLTATSRAWSIGERRSKRGLLMTIYGGKWSTYRALAQTIGDRITSHFGEFRPSRTMEPSAWAGVGESAVPVPDVIARFAPDAGIDMPARRLDIGSGS